MSPLFVLLTRPSSVRCCVSELRTSKSIFPSLRIDVSPKAGFILGLAPSVRFSGYIPRRHSCFLSPPSKQPLRCNTGTGTAMAQLHTRGTKVEEPKSNGNGTPHDQNHDDHGHSHSHSIFGHSHSHNGENGHAHSHDAEHVVAALRGDKRETIRSHCSTWPAP